MTWTSAQELNRKNVWSGSSWAIDKVTEYPIDGHGQRLGKNQTWYDCLFNGETVDCYHRLKDAIKYCQRRHEP